MWNHWFGVKPIWWVPVFGYHRHDGAGFEQPNLAGETNLQYFDQNIGLSGPEYGDIRINDAEFGKCPPEGTP